MMSVDPIIDNDKNDENDEILDIFFDISYCLKLLLETLINLFTNCWKPNDD